VPREPGSYLLVLRTERRVDVVVGSLGARTFRRGWHVYAGSARAGLRARLRHHLAPGRPAHWHVDALRRAGRLAELWVVLGSERLECGLAAALAGQPGAQPCPGFGSTDCRCPGHLVSFPRRPQLGALWPGLTRLPASSLSPAGERGKRGRAVYRAAVGSLSASSRP
jgi:Uri superfamily endonuclease